MKKCVAPVFWTCGQGAARKTIYENRFTGTGSAVMKNSTDMQSKLHIKKGDIVRVIAGNDRGTEAKVLMVDHKKNRALVEGVNMVSKHTKPNAANPQGGISRRKLRYTFPT
jgi:transcription antitermination factor NusG